MNLSKVDQKLLSAAVSEKRSATALSEAVGGFLSPEQALLRLKQLLSDSNPLDDLEERRLLVLDARRVMAILNESVEAGDVKAMETYRKFLTTVADRLDKSQANVEAISLKLSAEWTQIISTAFLMALGEIPKRLEEQGVIIDAEEVMGVFQEVYPIAVTELEANTE